MQRLKISYIIPAYNCETYIETCVDALSKQGIDSYEVIIVDDGSTDGTAKLCDKMAAANRNITVIHKRNEGQGVARNIGIEHSSGDWIAFIDADDQPCCFSYGTVLKKMDTINCDWAICGWDTFLDYPGIRQNEVMVENFAIRNLNIDNVLLDMATGKNRLSSAVWNKIYRANIIKENNVRFKSERVVISEDFLFNCDYARFVKAPVWMGMCLYYYRINQGSFCHKYQNGYYGRLIQLKEEIDTRYRGSELIYGLYFKLYSFIKSCIIQEAQFKPFLSAYREIKNICINDNTREILTKINLKMLDKKNCLIFGLIKRKRAICLLIMYRLKR